MACEKCRDRNLFSLRKRSQGRDLVAHPNRMLQRKWKSQSSLWYSVEGRGETDTSSKKEIYALR